jgi:hypothetical protein
MTAQEQPNPAANDLQRRITSIQNAATMPSQIFEGEALTRIVSLVSNDVCESLKLEPTPSDLWSMTSQLKKLASRLDNKTDIGQIDDQDALQNAGSTLFTLKQLVRQQLWVKVDQELKVLSSPYDEDGKAKSTKQLQEDKVKITEFDCEYYTDLGVYSAIRDSKYTALNTINTLLGSNMSELTFTVEQLNEANQLMQKTALFLEALMNDVNIDIPTIIRENGIELSQELADFANDPDADESE